MSDRRSSVLGPIVVVAVTLMLVVAARAERPDRSPQTVSGRDFGAIPDDDRDDGPALQAALSAASGSNAPVTVELEPGRYDVESRPPQARQYLALASAQHVTLRAHGAVLVYAQPDAAGLLIVDSIDVHVEGLTSDYAIAPFAQGVVTDIDGTNQTVDVRIPDGFPGLDAPWFASAAWGTRHDPSTGVLAPASDLYPIKFDAIPVAARTWRLGVGDGVSDFGPGDGFVVPIRGYGAGVVVSRSDGTVLSDLTIRSAPGAAFTVIDSRGTVVEDSSVAPDPTGRRWISTSEDGIHHSGGGPGLVIRNNTFARMLDDGVNIYSPPGVIRATGSGPEADELTVERSVAPDVGDDVEVFDAAVGSIRGRGRVTSVEAGPDQMWRLALTPDVAGDVGDQVFVVDDVASGFEVVGNRFSRIRGRGVVVRGHDGLVAGNDFSDLTLQGIVVGNDADWPEGNIPYGIRIERNHLRHVATAAYLVAEPRGAAISVRTTRLDGQLARVPLVRSISILDNQIVSTSSGALYIGATSGVDVRRTEVRLERPPAASMAAIVIDESAGVAVDGLDVVVPGVDDCRRHGGPFVVDDAGGAAVSGVTVNGVLCRA